MPLRPTTDPTFAADVLAAASAVLVDFSADWCPPCRMITPILEQIAAQEATRLRVLTLDVDANPLVADLYGITSMPTLVLFRQGTELTRIAGVKPRELILGEIAVHLPSA